MDRTGGISLASFCTNRMVLRKSKLAQFQFVASNLSTSPICATTEVVPTQIT